MGKTPQYIKDQQNAYNARFDLIQIKLPKGTKEQIKSIIGENGSMAAYCAEIVKESLNNSNNITLDIQNDFLNRYKNVHPESTESDFINFCYEQIALGVDSEEDYAKEPPELFEFETDTPDKPTHPAPVKSADPVEDVKPSTGQQLDREKLEALQAEIERRKAKAEAEQEAKTAEQEAKEKDQRERAEAYNREMQDHVKRYGVSGKWLSEGGY